MKKRRYTLLLFSITCALMIWLGFYIRNAFKEGKIDIEWSTASELDTVGFNIYRSQKEGDPGVIVNDELIPASSDEQTGGEYHYTDTKVVPGQEYYYYLEDVGADSVTKLHGPVIVKAESPGIVAWLLTLAIAIIALLSLLALAWPL